MSFPLKRFLAEPSGQKVPEVPQLLRRFEMAAGDSRAGLRREVGRPRRPLGRASLEACDRLETVVCGLDLRGGFATREAVVCDMAAGPGGLAYAGYRTGEDVDHWWIGGDLDHAFRTAPEVITLLVGAGSLRGRLRRVARTSDSSVPLGLLASGRVLASMDKRIESLGYASEGALLDTQEALWLLAGSVAKFVRALPEGRVVRLLFRVPAEEHWLPLLPALYQGDASPELCTTWFGRTRRDLGLFQKRFTELLEEMLGEHRHRVRVIVHDTLHHLGSRIEAAVARGEKPSALGLLIGLREEDDLWKFVLHPRTQEAVWTELHTERLFAPEDPPALDGLAGLVNAADVVDLLRYGADGLAVVVDEANAARRMIGLAEHFARRHPDGAARMMAIGPLGKIFGSTPGPHGPFAQFRGDPRHMVVLDSDEPSNGKLVPTEDLFRELYSVR